MRVNFETDEAGRLQNVTTYPIDNERPILELPDDFNMQTVRDWIVKDGKLVHDVFVPQESSLERIVKLKRQLSETDYAVIKIAEGSATAEEYADVIAQRKQWRKEINVLEHNLTLEE